MRSGCSPCANACEGKFLRNLVSLGRRLEAQGDTDRAVRLYERGLELDNLSEELYGRLMLTYRNWVSRGRARGLSPLPAPTFGGARRQPSAETEAIYRSLEPV